MRRVKLISPYDDAIVYSQAWVDDEHDTVTFRLDDLPDEMVEFQVVEAAPTPKELYDAAIRWSSASLQYGMSGLVEDQRRRDERHEAFRRHLGMGPRGGVIGAAP